MSESAESWLENRVFGEPLLRSAIYCYLLLIGVQASSRMPRFAGVYCE